MAEKIPRITDKHVGFLSGFVMLPSGGDSGMMTDEHRREIAKVRREIQSLVEGVASGKLVVIPRQEIAKFFDAYRNSVVTPQMIAGAHSEADRLVFDTLAGWLDENSASTNQGATKENR